MLRTPSGNAGRRRRLSFRSRAVPAWQAAYWRFPSVIILIRFCSEGMSSASPATRPVSVAGMSSSTMKLITWKLRERASTSCFRPVARMPFRPRSIEVSVGYELLRSIFTMGPMPSSPRELWRSDICVMRFVARMLRTICFTWLASSGFPLRVSSVAPWHRH